jgi:TusA-related sulfurtransferase
MRGIEMSDSIETITDAKLDLRGVMCPYNYVKAKLKLESMEAGQVLSLLVDDGEPIRNVPKSVAEDGHTVLKQEKIDHYFRVLIKKQT